MTAFGKIHRSIWKDPEFLARSPTAKLLYIHLVTNPKINRVGVLDIRQDRWARATGHTIGEIDAAQVELEAARFVLVDEETEELAVRTYVKGDGFAGNWKLVKGMWNAWEGVESAQLRAGVLAAFPQEVWAHPNVIPPTEAQILKAQVEGQSIAHAIGNGKANRTPMPSAIGRAIPTVTATTTVAVDDNAPPAPPAVEHPAHARLGLTAIHDLRATLDRGDHP